MRILYNDVLSRKGVDMKLIYGYGYNSGGKFKAKVNSKNTYVYQVWRDMIKRCYGDDQKTYKECTVSEEFRDFQVFAEWATNQIGFGIKNYHMDKDILCSGNVKIYSRETVVFIPKDLNMFLTNSRSKRGKFPQGVSFKKSHSRYCAQIKKFGKVIHLGLFYDLDLAVDAYKVAKELAAKEWLIFIRKNGVAVDDRVVDWLTNYKYEEAL